MYLATRNAIYSAALSTEATATFMFLPSWNRRMTTNPYASLYRIFLHIGMPFLGLHTIRPTPKCRNTLLEQYTGSLSQTQLGYAHHYHVEY